MKLPVIFQRIEGAIIAIVVGILYFIRGGDIVVFIITILLVDAFMVGYFLDKKIGAVIYNLGHSYTISVAMWLFSYIDNSGLLASISAAWIVHIGIDRAFGFGLKELSGFNDTHLGKIGKKNKSF